MPPPPPSHFYCFYHHHGHHHHRLHISIVFPPPPPPPHFYCFLPTTTATFLLFSLHHHHISIVFFHLHHISIVFPPPPQPPHFHCFPSARFYKRLPTAILSSFCSNVSSCQEQSWFSSALSCLSSSSGTATPQKLHALVQVLYNVLKEYILIPYKDALVNLAETNVSNKEANHCTRG